MEVWAHDWMLLGWDVPGLRWEQTLHLSCAGCGQELRDEGKSGHAETPVLWAPSHRHRPAGPFLSETKHLTLLLSNKRGYFPPVKPPTQYAANLPHKEKKKCIKI